jgi:hypothetical protein
MSNLPGFGMGALVEFDELELKVMFERKMIGPRVQ